MVSLKRLSVLSYRSKLAVDMAPDPRGSGADRAIRTGSVIWLTSPRSMEAMGFRKAGYWLEAWSAAQTQSVHVALENGLNVELHHARHSAIFRSCSPTLLWTFFATQ
jgi:hypothetical protein